MLQMFLNPFAICGFLNFAFVDPNPFYDED